MSTTSPITTHVLDTALGRPAGGVAIILEYHKDGAWHQIASGQTNTDGRILDLMQPGDLEAGTFRMTFDTGEYHRRTNQEGFYPSVSVDFHISNPTQHFHIPLLLSPFGYSTYRGS